MNKKFEFFVILIIILTFLGFIFGIRAIYNFYKIQKIFQNVEINLKKENYYLKTTLKHNDDVTVTEAYYKDGVGKLIASNGIYTWTDGDAAYTIDEANKKIYAMDIEKSIGLVSNNMFASLIPGYSKNIFQKFIMFGSLRNSIKSTKMEEQNCYLINTVEKDVTKKIWVEKSRTKPVKAIIEFPGGDIYEYTYELSFSIVKLSDVLLPDISEYTLLNYETNEVILDSNILENVTN